MLGQMFEMKNSYITITKTSTSGFEMMIKEDDETESREWRTRLSKDFRTIGVCVETGGLFVPPRVTCFYT